MGFIVKKTIILQCYSIENLIKRNEKLSTSVYMAEELGNGVNPDCKQ
jgi:hypothetical protein